MPRPNQYPKTDRFKELEAATKAAGEKDDCGVKALAIVCNISYKKALDVLTKIGRQPKSGTAFFDMLEAIKELGFKSEQMEEQYFISDYPKPHAGILKNITTNHPDRFPATWVDGATYLLMCNNHILAVVDGVTHDWTRGRKKHAHSIYQIKKAS